MFEITNAPIVRANEIDWLKLAIWSGAVIGGVAIWSLFGAVL
jgi:hypothetical protein